MSKTLCKLKKSKRQQLMLALVEDDAKYRCRKCRRLSDKKKRLCKPAKVY